MESVVSLSPQLLNWLEGCRNIFSRVDLPTGFQAHFTGAGPWQLLFLFMLSSVFMIWRLNAVEKKGFEGSVIGTVVMPYCSGFANLAFAFVMGKSGGSATLVLENCIVNNVTNLTLLLGLPALLWGLNISGKGEEEGLAKLDYLSLLLTLIALLFFTAVVWALSREGTLDLGDGMVLIGLFLFWQVFQLFDVMKNNVRKQQSFCPTIYLELLVIGLCAWGTYISIDKLVAWVANGGGSGFISYEHLGLLSGILMVVPNGLLAFYYTAVDRSDIAYSSQIGDGHICIPMCIGLYAVFSPISVSSAFELGTFIIMGAGLAHLIFIGVMGRLPRIAGATLTVCYCFFIYKGIIA